jgi:hypothetical protein
MSMKIYNEPMPMQEHSDDHAATDDNRPHRLTIDVTKEFQMMDHQILTAASQQRAAQIFNVLSMIAVILMPAFPILLIWGAASIMVYAASAHHPNPVVREYIRFAGYRFYGLAGTLLVLLTFSNELKRFLGGALHMWLAVWILSFLVVVPLGLRDIWRASRENWHDMALEAI